MKEVLPGRKPDGTRRLVTVPDHYGIATGIMQAILRQIPEEEFLVHVK
nr:hypothetical protein [uncultured Methanoregula sp.]